MLWLSISVIILCLILTFFLTKLYILKKSFKEIENSLEEILSLDTNNIITISSNDKDIKKLVYNLNKEIKELRKQRIQYENGNQTIKNIITNISHDMRTPLTAIMGYIDLIKDEKENNIKKEYIDIIERKTNELKILTDNFFDFSKAVDIRNKMKKERCSLNEVLEESLLEFYSIFKNKNIIPKIEICKEKVYRDLDRILIKRVFENILSNICKYSKENFEVSLSKDGKIIFSNKTDNLDVVSIERIFDRYYTVENARKSAGIGLSIAKQLIELNNGKISAKYKDNYLSIVIEFY